MEKTLKLTNAQVADLKNRLTSPLRLLPELTKQWNSLHEKWSVDINGEICRTRDSNWGTPYPENPLPSPWNETYFYVLDVEVRGHRLVVEFYEICSLNFRITAEGGFTAIQ